LRNLADRVKEDIKYGSDNMVESNDPKLAEKIHQLREQMNDVDQKWQVLLATAGASGAEIADTDNERLKFSDFLSSIGKSMLDTQRQLDSESLAYLRENSDQQHVLPSIFRLPKLSAEMKFALEKQSGKEVNLVFFKNQNMAKELHQQSIKFELVSAPPPADAVAALRQQPPPDHALFPFPGAAAAIQPIPPNVTLVMDASDRDRILDAGFAARGEQALPDDAERNRVVILGVEPAKGFIVLYAEPKGRNNIGVWLYSEGKFRGIYKFDKANDPSEGYLRAFVSKLADDQQAHIVKP